jgi:hypothetical protein
MAGRVGAPVSSKSEVVMAPWLVGMQEQAR